MSNSAKIIKSLVKKNVETKPTFGTDPLDPWSTKANISEDAYLNRYLLSRGINPKFATKDQKVAHSKTGQYLKWRRDRLNMREDVLHEAVDKRDTITFDIPLLIRVLEFAREDLKSDINLHKMVERLLNIRGRGTLTMKEYGKIVKEEVESDRLDEISVELQHRYFKAAHAQKYDKTGNTPKDIKQKRSKGMNKVISRTLKRNVLDTPGASQDFKDQEARRGIGHVRDSVEVEGDLVEARMTAAMKLQNAFKREQERSELSRKRADELLGKKPEEKKPEPVKENTLDPLAATQAPFDCANSPDTTVPKMSNSARIIKAIYKKSGMVKEELYDHEKEDKSTAGLKKPKVQKTDINASLGDNKPQAAMIMTGGKTMTGSPRDTIEIDPLMRAKPGGPNDPTTKK